MPTLSAIAVRLELTTRSVPQVPPIDALTGEQPQAWRGEDLDIQIGVFDANGFCVSLANIDFLNVDIYPQLIPALQVPTNQTYAHYTQLPFPSVPPVPLLSVAIDAADITPTITRAAWLAGTAQQATASFTWIDTLSLNLGGKPTRNFGFTVHGLTSAGRKITYGGGTITFCETGEQGVYLSNTLSPTVIPSATILYVTEYKQLSFVIPMSIDGDFHLDGYFVELSNGNPTAQDITDNDGNVITDNAGYGITSN
jgi:hypothetical protein